jgi:ferredoxin-NADP reductase/bacterioferritin-associated ferredoxin
MSGSVSLFDPDTDHLFSIVGIGQSFGERALKTDDARSASAKADTPSVLFEIPHTHFNQTLQTDPTFQCMLDAMDFMNRLPGMGTSTSFPSSHNGEPCIVRIYHLDDGSELKTMWFPFVETFHLQSSSTPTQAFEWRDNPDTSNTRRRLLFNDQWHLSEMIATGKWRDLPWLIESALLKRVFESEQIDQFVETGRLPRPILISDVQEGIVCHCLGLTLHTLQQQIASGCTTRSALQQQTGCGMVCGGCIPTLDLLTGQSNWIPIQISRTPITEHVVLIRLSNEHVTLPKWTAGQHIVLSGKVFADSEIQWIERSYTIVSSENNPHLEIAVKREALGLFSRWLCDGEATLKDLRMSHPKGDVFWDPERQLICFVAGIGITPAISIVRTAVDVLKTGSQIQPIHIVYAFHSQKDAAFLDEIKEYAQMYDDIHVNLIESKKDGRISKATISAYIQESNAYLICGPLSFMDLVEGVLTPHIPSEQIHTEKFLHQPKATNSTVQDIEPRASFIHQAYWVGAALFLLIAFFFSSTTGQMLMTTGHPNVGHEALSCHECHTPSMGSTRQQAQALIQHWLNNRTVVSWQYEPVNNDVCIRCHDRSNDVHAAHLFQESKYADIRDTLGPDRCVSCHHEHRGVLVTQTMTFCQSCHQDMNFKNDALQPPNSPTHSDLVAQAQWDTCLGCHDYHGTHQWDSPTEFEQRIQASDVKSYLNGSQPLYTSPKEQP